MDKYVIGFNGSPRKNWNTAILLEKALAGAASKGVGTELVHLYDLDFKGCASCFACKTKGGKSLGRCARQDGLTPYLEKAFRAEAIFLGSPIYLGTASGGMRSCIERLFFPYLTYTNPSGTLFPRKIPVGLLYAMNTPDGGLDQGTAACGQTLRVVEGMASRIFGRSESLHCFDTWQFDDYSKFEASRFNAAAKARRRQEVFPLDCKKAFAMGARFMAG
ncbi:MAG: flavodoxin family protein [Planctomycetota bacterium]|jgi:multimeric flavodoxin WrbA|nr:flavodoxin family protein [Planctomycetota bacterium]